MTDNDIVNALGCCLGKNAWGDPKCYECPYDGSNPNIGCRKHLLNNTIDLINRQKAEIERLKEEVSKARRKALLEAKGKFAGHSDYHGDTILCKLICMAEGKEVGVAQPLDTMEIKAEAIKEFAERLKEEPIKYALPLLGLQTKDEIEKYFNDIMLQVRDTIDNLVKEMTGGSE